MPTLSSVSEMRFDRRRALKTLFCASAYWSLNLRPAHAEIEVDPRALHLLSIGDFGTTGQYQVEVANAMQTFLNAHEMKPEALLLLGDNFYSKINPEFTIESERWRVGFESMYPEKAFPGPCYVVLGNHDYHDNVGGEKVQLAYAAEKKTRWTLPSKWYRFELGNPNEPLATVLALDSNLPSVSGGRVLAIGRQRPSLTEAEVSAQQQWLEEQLAGPRAPMTIVIAHHPLYSNGSHGDTEPLVKEWGPLFQKHQVHLYLCGHDHDLQHLELEDLFTSFVVSGAGGARTRALKIHRRAPYGRDVYGFTHYQLVPGAIAVSHFDTQGTLLHRFTKGSDGSVVIG